MSSSGARGSRDPAPGADEHSEGGAVRPELGEEEGGSDYGDVGERKPEKMLNPLAPTRAEREEHQKSHLPFRSWCQHCVAGKGKEADCKKVLELPQVPEIHLDFMFMGEETGGKQLTFLVIKERISKVLLACVVPSKSSGTWIAKRVSAFMKEFGCMYTPINMKSDNEPAMLTLVEGVGRVHAAAGGARMNVENSPVYSHKSNRVIERGVQTAKG